ncbi:hypothetical protein GCM10025883_29730 [Mobilicoccus caccae]|uniref:Aldose 1-epimerase n=1 Tax=Mobilicoccus caccae TaxID=1859295 RepID=A0ABQ6ISL7_9MICO|nr:hypothetical protein GCM10025883_29730 [Mobilicoccus caccae]
MTSTKTPSSTGRQYELRHGDQVAIITEVGAALRLYRVGDRDVVVPFGEHELPPAVHGAVLLPWPNRIGDGTYEFDGATYRLDLSEPERHNAIHGLVRHTRWRCVEAHDSAIEMALELVPRAGYPFPLESRVRYDLGADGLSVSLVTTNLGDTDAPYGAGFHPWLSPGTHRLDDCQLSMDVETRVEVDDRLLPVAESTDIPPTSTSAAVAGSVTPGSTTASPRTALTRRCASPIPTG